MKRIYILSLFFFFLIGNSVIAQSDSEIDPDIKNEKREVEATEAVEDDYSIPEQYVRVMDKPMSQGLINSYTLLVRDMKHKDVMNRFKDFMKDKYDTKGKKVKGAKHEQYFGSVTVYEIGYESLDVYATTYENGRDSEITLWILSDGSFVTADDAKSDKIDHWVQEFGVYTEQYKIEKELKGQEDELKDLVKDYDRLQKNESKLHKKIAGWKEDIQKAERDLEKNAADQSGKTKEIEAQEMRVDYVRKKLSKF